MKATGNEILFCVIDLLLGGASAFCAVSAWWNSMHAGGPSLGAGLAVAIPFFAGLAISAIGSILAYGVSGNKGLVLVRTWSAARWLNYGVFISSSLYITLELLKGCGRS